MWVVGVSEIPKKNWFPQKPCFNLILIVFGMLENLKSKGVISKKMRLYYPFVWIGLILPSDFTRIHFRTQCRFYRVSEVKLDFKTTLLVSNTISILLNSGTEIRFKNNSSSSERKSMLLNTQFHTQFRFYLALVPNRLSILRSSRSERKSILLEPSSRRNVDSTEFQKGNSTFKQLFQFQTKSWFNGGRHFHAKKLSFALDSMYKGKVSVYGGSPHADPSP